MLCSCAVRTYGPPRYCGQCRLVLGGAPIVGSQRCGRGLFDIVTMLAQACKAKVKLIRSSWRSSSDAISLRSSSGRRRSGGSNSALPQSELGNGMQDQIEDKQYIRRQQWASRQSLQQAPLPQTTAQELLRVVDITPQLLIRRPKVLKEHYHETSMHIQNLIDARGVYNICVVVHAGNFW